MNDFEYICFKILKFINEKIERKLDQYKIKCNHTYPNGKSSFVEGEYSDYCKICGDNDFNMNYVDTMYEAYNNKLENQ